MGTRWGLRMEAANGTAILFLLCSKVMVCGGEAVGGDAIMICKS